MSGSQEPVGNPTIESRINPIISHVILLDVAADNASPTTEAHREAALRIGRSLILEELDYVKIIPIAITALNPATLIPVVTLVQMLEHLINKFHVDRHHRLRIVTH